MAAIDFTPQQRQAIESVGQSLIVSAAAGSGKTAVLAQRCAYLVCDAPPEHRCNIDELVVLTFTEAAAAEMRSRIVEAIRQRIASGPGDGRLREQLALVDAAHISTIHAFCLWLIRRWFDEADIDPAAAMLDADEASLLQREVLDALFASLYARAATCENAETSHADGAPDTPVAPAMKNNDDDWGHANELASRFIELVEDYGLGRDREVGRLVLKLSAFVSSLPNPDGWLNNLVDATAVQPDKIILRLAAAMKTELRIQAEHYAGAGRPTPSDRSIVRFYDQQIGDYAEQVKHWAAMMPDDDPDDAVSAPQAAHWLQVFEAVRSEIHQFEFSKARAPRLSKDDDPDVRAARDEASKRLSHVKKKLFADRLRKRFALFSVGQWREGLAGTAKYVATIVELVRSLQRAYAARKKRLDVLDFADLEQRAFALLSLDGDTECPSETARALHRRFAHVLVDEFQDVNPIQQAILKLVSRETDPDQADNLFVVGDIKQSIYRFRLAEPGLFAERLAHARQPGTTARAVFLQNNFRSRKAILDGVNLIFRSLMRPGTGTIPYDDEAELRPGLCEKADASPQPIELHLLERSVGTGAEEEGEGEEDSLGIGLPGAGHPSRWTAIEREAHVIGLTIRQWINSGEGRADGQALRYGDIAVLLRATKINAEKTAAMLASMNIPAHAQVSGSLFAAMEVRDVLAALNLLDNARQDIPLAAVLRSGILGGPFSEDDLVAVRCVDRHMPFHAAVAKYLEDGNDDDLRTRLGVVLNRIERYRNEARRRPLADVIWRLYDEQAYLAYAGGLPLGPQRRANLLKLHELARKFGSFRRQGIHRFLRFVESMEERDQAVGAAPASDEGNDVVAIMSIHQSKGLEFPVVFLPGIGSKFNLGDRSGRMIFERRSGLGLRVVDTEQMIEYPSATHTLAALEIEQSTREEELRILYVAMTRAKEKLVMLGSARNVDALRQSQSGVGSAPSAFQIVSANTPLDWMMASLSAASPGYVRGLGQAAGDRFLFDVHVHNEDEIACWHTDDTSDPRTRLTRTAAARCDPLPAHEPTAVNDATVEDVLSRMEYVYPSLVTASTKAAVAASEFKGTYDYLHSPEEPPARSVDDDSFSIPVSKYAAASDSDALRRGVVTHRVLQHLDYMAATDESGVKAELARLVNSGIITTEECERIDRAAIAWFVSTPLADSIRLAGKGFRREFPFIASESPDYFDDSVEPQPGDAVLVRGIVDAIVPTSDGIEIIDFKTDAILAAQVPQRAESYRPQLALYARAMAPIWRRPVRNSRLVFLTPRKIVSLDETQETPGD